MRILGITIPDEKKVVIGLTHLYGVGHNRAQKILEQAKIDTSKKVSELNEKEETAIRTVIDNFTLEGDLKRETSTNIKRLKDIKSYRGLRHSAHLPSRGQRTKTNSRTLRGNKRTTMSTGRRSTTA